jgi:hypothetical protein
MVAVDVGNIMDRGDEEYYISSVIELAEGDILHSISWEAEMPVKTWVRAKIRTAETREELETKAFIGPDGSDTSYYENGGIVKDFPANHRYVQYKLILGAINSLNTPRITSVTLSTL